MPDDQQPQQQGFDWGSVASSLIPAAVGLAAGGRNRGLYGAYGFAEGMTQADQQERERLKYNNQLILKQQEQALRERQISGEEKHWEAANKLAEQNAQLHQVQMAELQRKTAEAKTSGEARTRLAESITDPAKRDRFLLDPDAYMKQELEEQRLTGAGKMLSALGVQNGEELAHAMGSKGTADTIEAMVKAKNTPQKPFQHYDSASGMFIYGTPGDMKTQQVVNPADVKHSKDPERAHAIMQEAQNQVETQFRGALGEVKLDQLGATPEEQARNFQRMISERARVLATERGLPDLFQKPPEDKTKAFIRGATGGGTAGAKPAAGPKEAGVGMIDLPDPPKGKMLLKKKDTGEMGFADVGEVPAGFSRLR